MNFELFSALLFFGILLLIIFGVIPFTPLSLGALILILVAVGYYEYKK